VTVAKAAKKLIYILGCGRSGTTVLGFVLGNGEKCLDLGEVNSPFGFLGTKGVPNEFADDTPNGRFWKSVKAGVEQEVPNVFHETNTRRLIHIASHYSFLRLYTRLFVGGHTRAYGQYINSLYRNILENAPDKEFYVDSSKTPGTALLYLRLLKELDVYLLHLVRLPVGVVESLTAKNRQPGNKGFLAANLYYFFMGLFCSLVRLRSRRSRYLKIRYEDLLQDPRRTLGRISEFTGLDLCASIEKIESSLPLKRGHVFNGNRMRMRDEVVLNTANPTYKKSLGNRFINLMHACWY